jgi:hypothetical protein
MKKTTKTSKSAMPSNPISQVVQTAIEVPTAIKDAIAPRADLRNQVTQHSPKILSALQNRFGISQDIVLNAMNGDISAAKTLGEMARIGDIQKQFAPLVSQRVIASIEGTTAVNQAQADIINAAKSNGLTIERLENQAKLGEQSFGNQIEEMKIVYNLSHTNEQQRHMDSKSYVEMKAYVDAHVKNVDQQLKLHGINTSVQAKQLSADKNYESRAAQTWLSSGDGREIDLIERPEYTMSPIGQVRQFAQNIKNALGF